MNEFKPEIVEEWQSGETAYATILAELSRCPICRFWMLERDRPYSDPWPRFRSINQDAQMTAAGWRYKSTSRQDGETVCEVCKQEGKVTFTCALCLETRDSSLVKDSFGDPPEFLCKVCFTTKPAAEWDAKSRDLRDVHRYDFD